MKILFIIGFIIVFVVNPFVRCVSLHPVSTIYYGVIDIYKHFRYHLYDDAEPTVGEISCFSGLFGHGKTLSEVHHVCSLYKRYNGKRVFKDGRWVVQNVVILSNVELKSVPYRHFANFQQLVDMCDSIKAFDEENDSYSVVYVIIDEMQNVCNSRNFKTNFQSGSDVLRVLTQIRKYHCSVWYTSTRFNQTDAFVRQDTMYVYECHKYWRLQLLKKYDAWDMENCTNSLNIKPLSRRAWFVCDKDYAAYDTHSLAELISHDVAAGEMIPQSERVIDFSKSEDPIHPSRRFKKLRKKA